MACCFREVLLFLFLLQDWTGADPTGAHTCQYSELETKQINTTYLQSTQVRTYKFCLTQITLRCAEYKNVMEPRWKLENISRVVIHTKCCSGYEEVNEACVPRCSKPCLNGDCVEPETCRCKSGFSGNSCEVSGCPNGKWGPDCQNECSCENGGFCNPTHGGCSCTPGYHGLRCQNRCFEGFYGPGCRKECSCKIGSTCNHVTGDCVPCPQGSYGEHCLHTCQCDELGTEMCSGVDGKCFCKENRFGLKCELSCPFGFINSTCYTEPINNNSCQCSNHMFICDMNLGCICPPGRNCGVQQPLEVLEVAPLSDDQSQTNTATVAVITVLILALVIVVLVIVYYRRRMKVLKTDLEHRSVRYTQSPYPYNGNDIVIQDNHPLEASFSTHQTLPPPQEPATISGSINNSSARLGLLNNQLSLASQQLPRVVQESKKQKNTNIDNFKLGTSGAAMEEGKLKVQLDGCQNLRVDLADKEEGSSGCCSSTYGAEGGAEPGDPDQIGEGSGVLFADVNILREEKEKEKAMKNSLSLSFKNNLSRTEKEVEEETERRESACGEGPSKPRCLNE